LMELILSWGMCLRLAGPRNSELTRAAVEFCSLCARSQRKRMDL
jgi:hypothetical protein